MLPLMSLYVHALSNPLNIPHRSDDRRRADFPLSGCLRASQCWLLFTLLPTPYCAPFVWSTPPLFDSPMPMAARSIVAVSTMPFFGVH